MTGRRKAQRVLDVAETAQHLAVSADTVRAWAAEGILTPRRPRGEHESDDRFEHAHVEQVRRLLAAVHREVPQEQPEQPLMLQLLEELRAVRSELALLIPSRGAAAAADGERGSLRGLWAGEARASGVGDRILPLLTPRSRNVHSIRAAGLRQYAEQQRKADWLAELRARVQQASEAIQRGADVLRNPGSGPASGRLNLAGYDARHDGLGPLRIDSDEAKRIA